MDGKVTILMGNQSFGFPEFFFFFLLLFFWLLVGVSLAINAHVERIHSCTRSACSREQGGCVRVCVCVCVCVCECVCVSV